MLKNIKIFLMLLAATITLSGCQAKPVETGKIKVTASFYPLYYFATQIGGDKVEVLNITPSGSEPHDYEPTAQDMVGIEQSRLLILNGLGLESWSKNIENNINPQKTVIVYASNGLIDSTNPHIWIAPAMAENIVQNILEGYIKIDPTNAEYYQANTAILKNKLISLDSEYQTGLANCQLRTFVTSHDAFGYLAQIYNLRQISIAGLSPDAEPSPAQLANVAKTAKAENVKYIFFESLVSPKLSQTIATEIGAQTLVLNPIEGLTKEEISHGQDYFTVEENNLKNLQTALECQK